jgi:hypothetical protein
MPTPASTIGTFPVSSADAYQGLDKTVMTVNPETADGESAIHPSASDLGAGVAHVTVYTELFADGFESGDSSARSATVP